MKKFVSVLIILVLLLCSLSLIACEKTPKIGVSMGVGAAARWANEEQFMKEAAAEMGAKIEIRRNTTDVPTQKEDCIQLIDSGINSLIFVPRDVNKIADIKEILDYAKKKKVKVVTYARMLINNSTDIFVGYDSGNIGEQIGKYAVENKRGNYIMLNGPTTDNNAIQLYDGAMTQIKPFTTESTEQNMKINIVGNIEVPDWSVTAANALFSACVDKLKAEGTEIHAVIAANDKLAGEASRVLLSKGFTSESMPLVTGMDAEIDAIKRIVASEQTMTVHMDFKKLARKAVEIACLYANNKKVVVNEKIEVGVTESGEKMFTDAHMITGDVITKLNYEKLLIDTGYYTLDQIFGTK